MSEIKRNQPEHTPEYIHPHDAVKIRYDYVEPFEDEFAPASEKYFEDYYNRINKRPESQDSEAGPHTKLSDYYALRERIIRKAAKANSRRGFISKNEKTEGLDETIDQYGSVSKAIGINEGAKINQSRFEKDLSEKELQYNELIEAGFSVGSVKRAMKEIIKETDQYIGPNNAKKRESLYRETNSKQAEMNKNLSIG